MVSSDNNTDWFTLVTLKTSIRETSRRSHKLGPEILRKFTTGVFRVNDRNVLLSDLSRHFYELDPEVLYDRLVQKE